MTSDNEVVEQFQTAAEAANVSEDKDALDFRKEPEGKMLVKPESRLELKFEPSDFRSADISIEFTDSQMVILFRSGCLVQRHTFTVDQDTLPRRVPRHDPSDG